MEEDTNVELIEAIKERDKFLKKYPWMQKYQDIINDELKDIEDPMERMFKIIEKINENQCKLVEIVLELKKEVL